jgi:hypothetical protein
VIEGLRSRPPVDLFTRSFKLRLKCKFPSNAQLRQYCCNRESPLWPGRRGRPAYDPISVDRMPRTPDSSTQPGQDSRLTTMAGPGRIELGRSAE